jgi:hypothetical protein
MPKVVLNGMPALEVPPTPSRVMSDRMMFWPNRPMSRPNFRVPQSLLPNWK